VPFLVPPPLPMWTGVNCSNIHLWTVVCTYLWRYVHATVQRWIWK